MPGPQYQCPVCKKQYFEPGTCSHYVGNDWVASQLDSLKHLEGLHDTLAEHPPDYHGVPTDHEALLPGEDWEIKQGPGGGRSFAAMMGYFVIAGIVMGIGYNNPAVGLGVGIPLFLVAMVAALIGWWRYHQIGGLPTLYEDKHSCSCCGWKGQFNFYERKNTGCTPLRICSQVKRDVRTRPGNCLETVRSIVVLVFIFAIPIGVCIAIATRLQTPTVPQPLV